MGLNLILRFNFKLPPLKGWQFILAAKRHFGRLLFKKRFNDFNHYIVSILVFKLRKMRSLILLFYQQKIQ